MPPPPPPGFMLDDGGPPPPPPGFTLDQPSGSSPPASYSVDPQGNVLRNGAIAYGPDSQAALSETAQAGKVVPGILAAGLLPGAAELVPGGALAMRIASNPLAVGAYEGGKTLLTTGSPTAAAWSALKGGAIAYAGGKVLSRSLLARLAHTIGFAAPEVAAAAEAAPAMSAAEEASIRSFMRAPEVAIAPQAPPAGSTFAPDAVAERLAIREAQAAPAAAPTVARTPVLPQSGNVKPATVFTRPAGLPPSQPVETRTLRTAAARSLAERQQAAAAEAGTSIQDAFGTGAPAAVPAAAAAGPATTAWREKYAVLGFPGSKHFLLMARPMAGGNEFANEAEAAAANLGEFTSRAEAEAAAQRVFAQASRASTAAPAPMAAHEAESPLETQLRASVMAKKDPTGLAQEVGAKVLSLKAAGSGLSSEQVAQSISDLYGFKPADAKLMVEMVFQAHGLK